MTADTDPFYARLSQLLPDVDIVVLPPEPAREPLPALDSIDARRAAEAAAISAESSLRSWWSLAAPAGLEQPVESRVRWQPGSDGSHVDAVAIARSRVRVDSNKLALFEGLRDAILARGCTVVRDQPDVGWLRFDAGDCVLEVHSPPDVAWCSVSATVPHVRVDQLATTLAIAPPIPTPWRRPESE